MWGIWSLYEFMVTERRKHVHGHRGMSLAASCCHFFDGRLVPIRVPVRQGLTDAVACCRSDASLLLLDLGVFLVSYVTLLGSVGYSGFCGDINRVLRHGLFRKRGTT